MPLCLVSCRSLKALRLNLENRPLKLPKSINFLQLKSLHLYKVDLFDDDETVQHFFSSCQVLEHLKIESCLFSSVEFLYIFAASLKSFELVEDCFEDPVANSLCKIKLNVDCPNLASFIFIGFAGKNVSFQPTSSLEKAFFCLTGCTGQSDQEVGYFLCDIASIFFSIKVLKLSMASIWYFDFMFANFGCFITSNLKVLKLQSWDEKDVYNGIITLLKCSPILENLVIDFDEYWAERKEVELKDEPIPCLTDHLKVVQLNFVEDADNELEFIRFLLKNGLVLEKIVAAWWEDLEDIEETLRNIMEFPRSSPNVELIFLEFEHPDKNV